MRHTLRLLCALGALAFLASACSSTSEKVSDKISKQVQDKLKLTDKPATTCPKDAKAKKGEKFDCTLTIEGQDVQIKVEFTKDNSFTYSPDNADIESLPTLEAALKKESGATKVSCGAAGTKLGVITASKPLVCTLTGADGKTQKVTYTIKNGKISRQVS